MSWRPQGSGIGSSNGRFQPCRDFISPQRRAAASSPAACARLDRSGGTSRQSMPVDRATPGKWIGAFRQKLRSMPARNRHEPHRSWRRFRPDVRPGAIPDRSRSSIARIGVVRAAAADRDRADPHVPVIDVPAIFAGIGRSAAGEGGHAALKRRRAGKQIP